MLRMVQKSKSHQNEVVRIEVVAVENLHPNEIIVMKTLEEREKNVKLVEMREIDDLLKTEVVIEATNVVVERIEGNEIKAEAEVMKENEVVVPGIKVEKGMIMTIIVDEVEIEKKREIEAIAVVGKNEKVAEERKEIEVGKGAVEEEEIKIETMTIVVGIRNDVNVIKDKTVRIEEEEEEEGSVQSMERTRKRVKRVARKVPEIKEIEMGERGLVAEIKKIQRIGRQRKDLQRNPLEVIGEIGETETAGENNVVQVKSAVAVEIVKITTVAMVKMVVLTIHGVAQEVWIVDLLIHIILEVEEVVVGTIIMGMTDKEVVIGIHHGGDLLMVVVVDILLLETLVGDPLLQCFVMETTTTTDVADKDDLLYHIKYANQYIISTHS